MREWVLRPSLWVALGALVVSAWLISRDAELFLDYARVLVWPFVALLAMVLFRVPLGGLFEGLVVKALRAGPVSAEFAPRADEQAEEEFDPDELVADWADEDVNDGEDFRDLAIGVLGLLNQAFQNQIDFLRFLRQAPEGLDPRVAEKWFRDYLEKRPGGAAQWDISALVQWLVNRGLVEVTPEGRYVSSPPESICWTLRTDSGTRPSSIRRTPLLGPQGSERSERIRRTKLLGRGASRGPRARSARGKLRPAAGRRPPSLATGSERSERMRGWRGAQRAQQAKPARSQSPSPLLLLHPFQASLAPLVSLFPDQPDPCALASTAKVRGRLVRRQRGPPEAGSAAATPSSSYGDGRHDAGRDQDGTEEEQEGHGAETLEHHGEQDKPSTWA